MIENTQVAMYESEGVSAFLHVLHGGKVFGVVTATLEGGVWEEQEDNRIALPTELAKLVAKGILGICEEDGKGDYNGQ